MEKCIKINNIKKSESIYNDKLHLQIVGYAWVFMCAGFTYTPVYHTHV